ncbi:MAG: hypothetical protein JEY96_12580 [Bacteroidales bacterium]|nr:hypothetical protein [Bacteroidales bacterium]
MNFRTTVLLKSICISIIFTFSAYNNPAQNKYSENSIRSSDLTVKKTSQTSILNLMQLDDSKIIEEIRTIEEWMLDENFWKIKPIDSQNDIISEKEWMKKHDFYIL